MANLLKPLPPLAPLSAQHVYHPSFISTGGGGGGGGGSGGDTGGGGGPTTWGPPPSDPGRTQTNCDLLTDPTCSGQNPNTKGGTGGGSGTDGTGGCSLWNPSSWTTSCILRVVLLILGIILIMGGVWMLKPAIVEKPLKMAKEAVEGAAIAAA